MHNTMDPLQTLIAAHAFTMRSAWPCHALNMILPCTPCLHALPSQLLIAHAVLGACRPALGAPRGSKRRSPHGLNNAPPQRQATATPCSEQVMIVGGAGSAADACVSLVSGLWSGDRDRRAERASGVVTRVGPAVIVAVGVTDGSLRVWAEGKPTSTGVQLLGRRGC